MATGVSRRTGYNHRIGRYAVFHIWERWGRMQGNSGSLNRNVFIYMIVGANVVLYCFARRYEALECWSTAFRW